MELKASRIYAVLVWLSAAAFSGVGIGFMVISPDDATGPARLLRNDAFRVGLGSMATLIGGVMLVALIYRLVRRRPLGIRLDSRGLTDQFHGLPFGLVPWSEITAIEVTRGVTVRVADPVTAFPSLPGWLARMNPGMHIPSSATRLQPAELAELLESWRAYYAADHEEHGVPDPDGSPGDDAVPEDEAALEEEG